MTSLYCSCMAAPHAVLPWLSSSSGSSARSHLFTPGAGWCLGHHIWYLTPHFLSRLSPSSTALCTFPLMVNPCSTSKVPNLGSHIFVATWRICFEHFDSCCQHYTTGNQLPWADPRPSHCTTNILNSSKNQNQEQNQKQNQNPTNKQTHKQTNPHQKKTN